MNRVTLSGRLGRDPELKYTTNNTPICNTSIAIEEYKKEEGAPGNWQQIQLWKQSAEFLCENAQKGDKIFIEGRIQNDTWETNGETKYRTYVIVEKLEMLPREKSKSYDYGQRGTTSIPGPKNTPPELYESKEESLPF